MIAAGILGAGMALSWMLELLPAVYGIVGFVLVIASIFADYEKTKKLDKILLYSSHSAIMLTYLYNYFTEEEE